MTGSIAPCPFCGQEHCTECWVTTKLRIDALRAKLTARKKQVKQLESALHRLKHADRETMKNQAYMIKCLTERIKEDAIRREESK